MDVSRAVCFWLITQQVGTERQIQIANGAGERARELERANNGRERCRALAIVCRALWKNVNGTFARLGDFKWYGNGLTLTSLRSIIL